MSPFMLQESKRNHEALLKAAAEHRLIAESRGDTRSQSLPLLPRLHPTLTAVAQKLLLSVQTAKVTPASRFR